MIMGDLSDLSIKLLGKYCQKNAAINEITSTDEQKKTLNKNIDRP